MHNKFTQFRNSKSFGLIVLFALVLCFWIFFRVLSPDKFGSVDKMLGYLQTSIQYAVGGCGFYFIVVMGLFDFSVGANIVLSSVVGVLLSRYFGYWGLIFGCILCGTLIGLFNGVLYTKLRIPSIIVTVGLMLILESVANYVFTLDKSGFPGKITDSSLLIFGKAPMNYILAFSTFILMYVIIRYTKIGTYCNAIGSNEFIAKIMGINVEKYKIIGFVIFHFFVGTMALLTVSYGRNMQAVTGMASMDRNFRPLMGTFFGVAFKKYGCPITAIVIGEFIITLIFNGLVALNVSTSINDFITGVVLLTIVTLTNRGKIGSVVK